MGTRGLNPLAGLRVVVTRAEHQSEGLAAAFTRAGAAVELLPLLEVVPAANPIPLERAAAELFMYDWVVFTSSNAVQAFLAVAGSLPPPLKIAAVGPATAEALRSRGLEPHLTPGKADAEGLAAELAPEVAGRRVLLPQAADALPTLLAGLTSARAEAVAVVAYGKRLPADAHRRAAELFASSPLGWVTFTSPRIVRHFIELFGGNWERRRPELRAASIGPVTSTELRRWEIEPAAEARRPSNEEMVEAVARAVGA
jgi:uroporphyrinogen-III synthase